MQRRIVLIIGPTAVGKTDVAMALQDLLGGRQAAQLISADSAMVYRGLDIGSAKPNATELAAYPHELIDIREPEDAYTAADFVADADRCVEHAFDRGQVPILVGGTMLYAKRFIEGIAELPSADAQLREELQQQFEEKGGVQMHAELNAIDPAAAAKIHPNNPQRLLRALEVVRLTGRPLSAQWQEFASPPAAARLRAQVLTYAILPDNRAALHERIAQRFDAMLAADFIGELKTLQMRAVLYADLPAMRAVGYRQGWQFLAGELSEHEFRDKVITATRRLAKKQLTWLRRWPDAKAMTWGDSTTLAAQILADLEP